MHAVVVRHSSALLRRSLTSTYGTVVIDVDGHELTARTPLDDDAQAIGIAPAAGHQGGPTQVRRRWRLWLRGPNPRGGGCGTICGHLPVHRPHSRPVHR